MGGGLQSASRPRVGQRPGQVQMPCEHRWHHKVIQSPQGQPSSPCSQPAHQPTFQRAAPSACDVDR